MSESQELLRDDPLARAAYSGNPGFIEGADIANPITCDKKSLLAQPEIAEGLEAIYLAQTGELDTLDLEGAETEIMPLDFGLAKGGLTAIRKTIQEDSGRSIKEAAISVKSQLVNAERIKQERLEQSEAAAERARQEEADRQAMAGLEEAAQALQERIDQEERKNREELERSLAVVEALYPHLDFERIRLLNDRIPVVDNVDEANPVSKETISHRVLPQFSEVRSAYMEDPAKLWNDVEATIVLHDWSRLNDEAVAYTYAITFPVLVIKPITEEFYFQKDFTAETVHKWLLCMTGQHDESRVDNPPSIDAQSTAVQFGEKVLSNSLRMVGRQDPGKLVDNMYVVAEAGLGSDDPKMQNTTALFLSRFLHGDALATHLLYLSTISGNPKLQRRGADLSESLKLVLDDENCIPRDNVFRRMGNTMPLSDLKLLWAAHPKELSAPDSSFATHRKVSLDLDKRQLAAVEAFRTSAAAESPDTIYGRLAAGQ